MFALILKNLSDRQISIDKKLVDFIIKRIDRSYGKIFDFIYKIDKISLKLISALALIALEAKVEKKVMILPSLLAIRLFKTPEEELCKLLTKF